MEAPAEARTSSEGVTKEAATGISPWPPATWYPMTPTRPGASRRATNATATRETGEAGLEAEGALSSGAVRWGTFKTGTGKGVREKEADAAGREFPREPTDTTGGTRKDDVRNATICWAVAVTVWVVRMMAPHTPPARNFPKMRDGILTGEE